MLLKHLCLFLDSDPEAVEPEGLYIQRPVTRKGLSLITLKRNAILIRPVRYKLKLVLEFLPSAEPAQHYFSALSRMTGLPFLIINICSFQGSSEPFYFAPSFIRHLTLSKCIYIIANLNINFIKMWFHIS